MPPSGIKREALSSLPDGEKKKRKSTRTRSTISNVPTSVIEVADAPATCETTTSFKAEELIRAVVLPEHADTTPPPRMVSTGTSEEQTSHNTASWKASIETSPPSTTTTISQLPHDVPVPVDWYRMFFEAVLYRANYGDLHVSAKDEKNKNLFQWMQHQRKEFKVYQEDEKLSELSQQQVTALDSLQFHWHTRGEEHWKRSFEMMKDFYAQNGHCLVPRQQHAKLGDWVTEQRRQHKYLKEGKPSTLTKEREALLNELGFVWQVRQRTGWMDRYEELCEYKRVHDTVAVPQFYKENRALGKWVAKQREQYRFLKEGKHSFLTPDRVQQLKDIGFIWSLKGRSAMDDDLSSDQNLPCPESNPELDTTPSK